MGRGGILVTVGEGAGPVSMRAEEIRGGPRRSLVKGEILRRSRRFETLSPPTGRRGSWWRLDHVCFAVDGPFRLQRVVEGRGGGHLLVLGP